MPVRSPRSSWRASSNLKYSPPSSVMCTRPSTYIASSVTKMPKLVAALTTPPYSSPRCSRMYLHLSQASTSRLASSARRSLALQCRPAASQACVSRLRAFDVFLRGLVPARHAGRQPLGQLGMRLARRGQHGQLVPGAAQNGLDDTVHQQVGVAPDRAGEVRVGLECQAEVAAVDGRVDGLLHGAQQHGVDLLRVRPLFGGLGNGLEFRRAWGCR
jgi:hypothetical protein